jgi:hypothetical protein
VAEGWKIVVCIIYTVIILFKEIKVFALVLHSSPLFSIYINFFPVLYFWMLLSWVSIFLDETFSYIISENFFYFLLIFFL